MTMRNRFAPAAAAAAGFILLACAPAHAEGEVPQQTAYIFNTLLFLMGGFLVMWMGAGFCMLEAGLVRSKNVADICLKNIGLFAISGIMFYLLGYQVMYAGVDGGLFGSFSIWSASEVTGKIDLGAYLAGSEAAKYASASDWFFQMVFVATAASIVSGTLAERIKLFPFFIFTMVLTALIYPIAGAWHWGAGWLQGDAFKAFAGGAFKDFAGSTIVHSTGGWAALIGALVLGPRIGKYVDGKVRPMPGSSMPLATLGTFILWLGWFGFNGSSQLAMGSIDDVVAVAQVYANTTMAAAGGVVAAILLTKALYKKVDLTMTLNGALAGLVSITAEPLTPTVGQAILIGGVGAVLVVFAVPLLDRLRIDDVVGAISVHLVAGVWGTLAVALTNPESSWAAQIIGIVSIGGFVAVSSLGVWLALKHTMGIRLSEDQELAGSDISEVGLEAYPEFGRGTQSVSA